MRLLPALFAVVVAGSPPTLEGAPRPWETETDFHSGPGGRWQLDVYPTSTTAYRVRWNGRTSRVLNVRVRPSVVLRPDGRGRFVVSITAARDFDGRTALLERLDRRTRRYVRLMTIRFDDAGPAGQMRVTTAYVRAAVAPGTRMRAVFPRTACYLAGFSNTLTL